MYRGEKTGNFYLLLLHVFADRVEGEFRDNLRTEMLFPAGELLTSVYPDSLVYRGHSLDERGEQILGLCYPRNYTPISDTSFFISLTEDGLALLTRPAFWQERKVNLLTLKEDRIHRQYQPIIITNDWRNLNYADRSANTTVYSLRDRGRTMAGSGGSAAGGSNSICKRKRADTLRFSREFIS